MEDTLYECHLLSFCLHPNGHCRNHGECCSLCFTLSASHWIFLNQLQIYSNARQVLLSCIWHSSHVDGGRCHYKVNIGTTSCIPISNNCCHRQHATWLPLTTLQGCFYRNYSKRLVIIRNFFTFINSVAHQDAITILHSM